MANEKRKQISVAFTQKELNILDDERGTVPRGTYLRELFLQKKRARGLVERVSALKEKYYDHFQKMPTEVAFSPREEFEIESMGRSELGEIIGEVTIRGARTAICSFLGLKTKWGEPLLIVRGAEGGITEDLA